MILDIRRCTIAIAIMTVALFTTSTVSAGTVTASTGYSFVSDSAINNPKGFNIKYGYEWDGVPIGIISSFTYLSSDVDKGYNYERVSGNAKKEINYRSFAVGPTWRINNILGVYGLVGVGKTDNQYRIKKSANERTVVSFDKTNAVYGAGVWVNVAENAQVSAGFETSRYDDADNNNHTMNVYNVNVGYSW